MCCFLLQCPQAHIFLLVVCLECLCLFAFTLCSVLGLPSPFCPSNCGSVLVPLYKMVGMHLGRGHHPDTSWTWGNSTAAYWGNVLGLFCCFTFLVTLLHDRTGCHCSGHAFTGSCCPQKGETSPQPAPSLCGGLKFGLTGGVAGRLTTPHPSLSGATFSRCASPWERGGWLPTSNPNVLPETSIYASGRVVFTKVGGG